LSVRDAAVGAGVSEHAGAAWFGEAGGMCPVGLGEPSGRYLSVVEREQIAVWWAAEVGIREIARRLGRSAGTISRELDRNRCSRRAGGPGMYLASVAQEKAEMRARRPKPRKLATCLSLRREVQNRLIERHSPEQIAARLRLEFGEDAEMRVSHETIYRSLYVQGKGGLRRELTQCLRTGRAVRKPHRKADERRGRIPGMINISERPAEVADRAVPGHWEGDLIIGKDNATAIGTLVERATRFVMLLHLPAGHGAEHVEAAMITAMAGLPATLRQTLTWDQGKEMANHAAIATATDLDIYFCDPHSPWQRGTNENTNGLLRQYFPKSTNLGFYGPGYLNNVADELNRRPRKTLGFKTPAEALHELLTQSPNQPSVATTG